jgi:hypothetical protein
MESYGEHLRKQEELIKSLEAFLVNLSPAETYHDGDYQMALFEADILVKCLELHKKLKNDLGKN